MYDELAINEQKFAIISPTGGEKYGAQISKWMPQSEN